VPVGGTAGQVLSKINATDYNTQWIDFTAGTAGTGGVYGVTTLEDSVASTSTTTAAVPNSVKTSYDLATTKAKVSVGTAAPVTPSTGDVWVDTAGTATAINAVPLAALTGTGAMIYGASAGTAATLAIGTAAQQLVVSGGVPAWATSPDIAKDTLTTTGDIIYASGSATPARLGVGTAGQVLGVAAGVPAWTTPAGGGGLTLIATATPSAATSLAFSSIPGTYKHLHLVYRNVFFSTDSSWLAIRFNSGTAALYDYGTMVTASSDGDTNSSGNIRVKTAQSANMFGNGDVLSSVVPGGGTASGANSSSGAINIYRYTELEHRVVTFQVAGYDVNGRLAWSAGNGRWRNTTDAITSIDFVRSSTQTITGTFYLYGVS
jgi:hypothetical protein